MFHLSPLVAPKFKGSLRKFKGRLRHKSKFTTALIRAVLVLSGSTQLGQERTEKVHCKVLITSFLANARKARDTKIKRFNGRGAHLRDLQQLGRQLEFSSATTLMNGTWQCRAPAPNGSAENAVGM